MVEPGQVEKKSRVEVLEETVLELIDKVEEQGKTIAGLEKTVVKKSTGLFGGKREKTAIKDSETGKIYPSKASVGKALATLIEGGDPGDHFMWYKLQAKFPQSFVVASTEEAEKVWADEKARQETEVAEANARLEAERKAKETAEKGTKKS